MSDNKRRSDQPPGTWIGNVFYSDVLAERYVTNVISRLEAERYQAQYDDADLLPSDVSPSEDAP